MKNLFFVFLFTASSIFAQESTTDIKYLDSVGKPASKETYYKYEVFEKDKTKPDVYILKAFDKQKKLMYTRSYSDESGKTLHGETLNYYPNGNKKSSFNYLNGKVVGKSYKWYENGEQQEESEYADDNFESQRYFKMISFWNEKGEKLVVNGTGQFTSDDEYYTENGSYKDGFKEGKWYGESKKNKFRYEEIYANGDLVSGVSTEENGEQNQYTTLEIRPEPIKGLQHFYKHISKNFKAPNSAYKNKVKGKIILTFVVDKDGQITEPKVVRGLGSDLDKEAIRVLTTYEPWKPALQKGRRVRCSFSIPIQLDFTL